MDYRHAPESAFGFTNPILVDSDGGIIAGHARLTAALSLQLQQVPVIVLNHLTPVQRQALTLADNKLDHCSVDNYTIRTFLCQNGLCHLSQNDSL